VELLNFRKTGMAPGLPWLAPGKENGPCSLPLCLHTSDQGGSTHLSLANLGRPASLSDLNRT